MAKSGIIGHRGAAGLALENSRNSLDAAIALGVDALELDVRRTKDGKLVVIHDRHTGRIADERSRIKHLSLSEVRTIRLKDGQRLLTLEEVLESIAGTIPLVIDIKDAGSVGELVRLLRRYPSADVSCTSLRYKELAALHKALPGVPFFIQDRLHPFDAPVTASSMHASGISLNKWLMNPLTYYLAKRRGLEIRLYTVDNKVMGKMFRKLYPGIVLYTNHPERFIVRGGR